MASPAKTWVIVGASRGIGLEFVRQPLQRGDQVIATIRDPKAASRLWSLTAGAAGTRPGACQLYECDVTSEASIKVRFSFILHFGSLASEVDFRLSRHSLRGLRRCRAFGSIMWSSMLGC